MFGIKKPHFPHRITKHAANPFDSDDELDKKPTLNPASSALVQNSRDMLFEDDAVKGSGYKVSYASKNKYKNDFVASCGIENQDVQELEHYAAYKSEETTKTVNNALKIAENIREDATKTLITLHQQGEQITRTHMTAADIEPDLSRGEKLLGSLGGIFSRTWKPKKGRAITGPVIMRGNWDKTLVNVILKAESLLCNSFKNYESWVIDGGLMVFQMTQHYERVPIWNKEKN